MNLNRSFLAVLISATLASPAHAVAMLIFANGERPQRQMYFVDTVAMKDLTMSSVAGIEAAGKHKGGYRAFRQEHDMEVAVPVTIVYEAESEPQYRRFNLEYRCRSHQMKVASGDEMTREPKMNSIPASDWTPVGDAYPFKIAMQLGCGDLLAARRAMHERASGKSNDAQLDSALGGLGVEGPVRYFHAVANGFVLSEQAWKMAWTDGTRKQTALTPKEQEQRKAELLAQADNVRQRATAAGAGLQKNIEHQQQERAFLERSANHRKQRELTETDRAMAGWIGKTEAAVRAKWGPPRSMQGSTDIKQYVYTTGIDTRSALVSGQTVVAMQGRFAECHATFEFWPDHRGAYLVGDVYVRSVGEPTLGGVVCNSSFLRLPTS